MRISSIVKTALVALAVVIGYDHVVHGEALPTLSRKGS